MGLFSFPVICLAWSDPVLESTGSMVKLLANFGSAGKESTWDASDLGLILGLGGSPGEGKGYSCQYSGLENSMDCIVYEVAKSQTRLRDFHFTQKRTYDSMCLLRLLLPVPRHHGRPLLMHTPAGDPQPLTGMSTKVSCGVTTPFFCVLLNTRFYLCSLGVSGSVMSESLWPHGL